MGRSLHFVKADATRDDVGEMARTAIKSYLINGKREHLESAVDLVARLKYMEDEAVKQGVIDCSEDI